MPATVKWSLAGASAAVFAFIAGLLVVPEYVAAAPSFDCGQASTPAEQTICDSAALSALDRAMAESLAQAIAVLEKTRPRRARQIEARQRQWITNGRNGCGTDTRCLEKKYLGRIDEIRRMAGLPPLEVPIGKDSGDSKKSAAEGNSPLAGQWQVTLRCDGRNSVEGVLSLASARIAGRLAGTFTYFETGRKQLPAVATAEITGRDSGDGTYILAASKQQGSNGIDVRGFSLRPGDEAASVTGTLMGGNCQQISAVRLSGQSDWLRPTAAAPAGGGSFTRRGEFSERCAGFVSWLETLGRQLPETDFLNSPVDDIRPYAALLYGDDDFVPVFGVPFDQTTPEWRFETIQSIRRNCLDDPIIRQQVRGLDLYLNGPFSPRGYPEAEARLRETRRLRHQLAAITAALSSADLAGAATLRENAASALRDRDHLVWPAEKAAMEAAVASRLAALAAPDTEAALLAFERTPASVRLIRELDAQLGGFDGGVFGMLAEPQKSSARDRLMKLREAAATKIVEPIVKAVAETPLTLAGYRLAVQEIADSSSYVDTLPDDLKRDLQLTLGALRELRLKAAVEAELKNLEDIGPGPEGLRKAAAWRAKFDQTYADLQDAKIILEAKVFFLGRRKVQLMASLIDYEAAVSKIVKGGANHDEALASLKAEYLAWPGDRHLPESLEYDFIIGEFMKN